MDRFRIKALLKHLPDSKIHHEIEKKLSILTLGGKKHKNKAILEFALETQNTLAKFASHS
jgi:hypothetical protein